ncbi:phospholipase DDHD1-like isoform X2 [Liolophura sinensis]|uniref:phospholipase DDHD1-like isoform X2 n=1 Tax=Liolophura sinensis TaxID=3198878 RepID=UPI003158C9D5
MDLPASSDSRTSVNNAAIPSGGESLYPQLDEFEFLENEEGEVSRSSRSSSPSTGSRPPSASPPPPHAKKYLYPKKEYVEELRPEEIRWFYRQEGDKKWTPFIGYDSLRIECKYREFAYGIGGTNDRNVEMILVRGGLYECDVISRKCYPVYWTGDVTEVMRGMWFYDGTWQPIDEGHAVQIETEHLSHFVGKKIEDFPTIAVKGQKQVIHNIKFRNYYVDWNGVEEIYMFSESASSRLVRHVSKSLGFQKWALQPVDSRFRSNALNVSGTRLQRGYCYEAIMDDKPADINHLVFVIHGIGQKMDTGSIVRCSNDLRDATNKQKMKLYPKFDQTNKRAEFLPVEWRSSLTLDGDIVESITPQKVRGLRTMLNSSAMDILYYTSPLYRSEITRGLYAELNRLFKMFCERHPYFESSGGKVSIVAHSLGAVITYDILSGWNPIRVYDQFLTDVLDEKSKYARGSSEMMAEVDKAKARVEELEALLTALHDRQQKANLAFQIENLFCLGSPLAVFLALRGMRPHGKASQEILLPKSKCQRIFNIYHPADPVAYRLEPLVMKHYYSILPVQVHRCDQTKRVAYTSLRAKAFTVPKSKPDEKTIKTTELTTDETIDLIETGNKENADVMVVETTQTTQTTQQKFSFSGMWSRFGKKSSEPVSSELKVIQKWDKEAEVKAMELEAEPVKMTAKAGDEIDATELEYRLDYQLRESNFENSYISAITSHTAYWSNNDVALFILTHLHPELQES